MICILVLAPSSAFAREPQPEDEAAPMAQGSCSEYWYEGSSSQNNEGAMSTIAARCPSEAPRYVGHSWYAQFYHDNGFCDSWPTPRTTLERSTSLYTTCNNTTVQNGVYFRGTLLRQEGRTLCEDQYGNPQNPDWWRMHVRLMCCAG